MEIYMGENESDEPVSVLAFEPLTMDYMNNEHCLLPHIGVYFPVSDFPSPVIAREYKVDLEHFVHGRGSRIFASQESYDFQNERILLRMYEDKHIQGVRISCVENMSFSDLANVIADLHKDSFFARHGETLSLLRGYDFRKWDSDVIDFFSKDDSDNDGDILI